MSCTSNGCRLAQPGASLSMLCVAGCRIDKREAARPAPPPEPAASPDQVGWQDSMFDVPPAEEGPR